MLETVGVGLIGLGTVGSGVARLLLEREDLYRRRLGISVRLVRIAEVNPPKALDFEVPKAMMTNRAEDVIDDPAVQIVVELIGGIHPAKEYILEATSKGKYVVTANKALLAEHGGEIFDAAERAGVGVGFEGSVGGGIPIIRALRDGLSANQIEAIYGILNGTSNYILSKMTLEHKPFQEVLEEARAAGYAEADPTLDVEGIDTAHKLAILVHLAFGTPLDFKSIYTEGITAITPLDIAFAGEFGYCIKLLAIAKRAGEAVEARVHPTMIGADLPLAQVKDVYNGIFVVGDAVGETLFYGKGAGRFPTASAVVADILESARGLVRGQGRQSAGTVRIRGGERPHRIKPIEEICSQYYLRIMAQDKPGVLSRISGILGNHNISISSVIQKGRKAGHHVPVVMMTHLAREQDIRLALEEIDALPIVAGKTLLVRVEGDSV